jgi:hypothetical protein
MDYEFFHGMTREEASARLNSFREAGRTAVEETRPVIEARGIRLDYSLESLPAVLHSHLPGVTVYHIPFPEGLPDWIRQSHSGGIRQFDEASSRVLFLAAYYFGECFARLPGMRWATGDTDHMYANMPVVKGFQSQKELSPLVVVRNMFARALDDPTNPAEFDETVAAWTRLLPRSVDSRQ